MFFAGSLEKQKNYVSDSRKKSVELLYLVSIFLLIHTSIYDAMHGYWLPSAIAVVGGAIFLAGFLLTRRRFVEQAIRVMLLLYNVLLFCYTSFFGFDSGLYLYYILIFIASSSLLKYKRVYQQVIYLGMPMLCVAVGLMTDFELFLIDHIEQEVLQYKHKSAVIGVFLLLQLYVSFIINSYNKHRDLLKTSEKKLRTILENNDYLIFLINESGDLLDFNQTFNRSFRRIFKSRIRKGESVLDFLGQFDDIKDWEERLQKAFRGETGIYTDTFLYGGQSYTYETKLFPVGTYPEIEKVTVMMNDITPHQQAQQKLKSSRKFLQFVIDNIPEGVFWKDQNSVYLGCNNKFAHLLGYESFRDVIGKTDFELLKDQGLATYFKEIDQNVMNNKKPYRMIHRSHVKNSDAFYFIESNKVVLEDHGQTIGVLGTIKDVTKLKAKEEELKDQNEALIKLNNELDSLIYRVSHDLRAPIASVLGLVNVARMESDLIQIHSYFDMQERSLKKLDRFIRDILIYSRNNRQEVRIEEVDLESLIHQVFEQHSFTEEAQAIRKIVTVELEGPFYSDRNRLEVILNNLVSNAVRYSAPDKPDTYIKVEVKGDQDQVKLLIEDNGQGISQHHIDKIFDMFYRANDRVDGTGLGLYLVKDTVRILKGEISVWSQYREKTAFEIVLPNIVPELDEEFSTSEMN